MILEDYRDPLSGKWVRHISGPKGQICTVAGSVWNAMRNRCVTGGSMQRNCPQYVGCTMSDNFKNFEFFANWYIGQIGYKQPKYHLDKDLLISGNRVYSEDNCVVIPRDLNHFITTMMKSELQEVKGVVFHLHTGKYQVRVTIDGKSKALGLYWTLEEGIAVYKAAKIAEARRWYSRLVAGEFIVDSRVIERMRVWIPN